MRRLLLPRLVVALACVGAGTVIGLAVGAGNGSLADLQALDVSTVIKVEPEKKGEGEAATAAEGEAATA